MTRAIRSSLIPIACAALIAGCDSRQDPYPSLMPTDRLLAEPTLPDHAADAALSPDPGDARIQGHADALRRRAEALRGPVIEPEIRSRLGARD